MRVIAGEFRGRSLASPPGLTTRPITDRVKESLFNVLAHRYGTPGGLPEIDVLDVFAGSGSLGIEALSRGARSCVFVERERRALRALRDNLRDLQIEPACRVLGENAWSMRPPRTATGFGLAFVDPPYRDAADPLRTIDLLERLGAALTPDGLLVFRHECSAAVPLEMLRRLRCVDQRRYGRMSFVLVAPGEPREITSETLPDD